MERKIQVQESTRDREKSEHGQDHWGDCDSEERVNDGPWVRPTSRRQMKNEKGQEMIKGHFRDIEVFRKSFWLTHKLT